jgi:hypothetical protein
MHVSGTEIDGHRILKLLTNPLDDNELFAVTGNARPVCSAAKLFRSIDGGAQWTQIGQSVGSVMDVDIHPTDPEILYQTGKGASIDQKIKAKHGLANRIAQEQYLSITAHPQSLGELTRATRRTGTKNLAPGKVRMREEHG